MSELVRVSINYKTSLVIILIDDYTAMPVRGTPVVVSIEELFQKPIKKNNSCYVFTNIELTNCHVVIKSNIFFEERIEVDLTKLDPLDPVVYVRLKPLPYYPYNRGDTLVRMMVKDKKNNKVVGAKVSAEIVSNEGCKVRIIQEKIEAGTVEVNFQSIMGMLSIGEKLFVKDGEKSEYCEIKRVLDSDKRMFLLANPLQYEHIRGVMLMPVVETYTDHKGEVVICLKHVSTKQIEVELKIEYKNEIMSETMIIDTLKVEVGKTLNIKSITI